MAFENVGSVANKTPNQKPVYLRISPGGSCYLSAGFRDLQPELYSSIDFEIDLATGEFRFRVGKGYDRNVLSGGFCLPAEITRLITNRNGTKYNRTFYYQIVRLENDWYTGKFVAVNKAPKLTNIINKEKE